MGAVSVLDPHAARTVFDAACAMAWADGELLEPELAALRGLALSLGLSDVVDGTESAITQRRVLPNAWRLARLDARGRVLCVAAAAWVAIADRHLDPREEEVLAELAERCDLGHELARFATAHAAFVTSRTGATLPHHAATFLLVEGARRSALLHDARRSAA